MIKIINDLFKRFITGLSGDIVDTSDESLGKDSPNHDGQVSETEYAGLEPNFSLDTLKGETILVDSMITSILYEKSSKEVIIIMIDPKEQLCYGSLLHEPSRQQDYANSSDSGMELLSLLLEERDEQARLLVESNQRNMDEYNKLQS